LCRITGANRQYNRRDKVQDIRGSRGTVETIRVFRFRQTLAFCEARISKGSAITDEAAELFSQIEEERSGADGTRLDGAEPERWRDVGRKLDDVRRKVRISAAKRRKNG